MKRLVFVICIEGSLQDPRAMSSDTSQDQPSAALKAMTRSASPYWAVRKQHLLRVPVALVSEHIHRLITFDQHGVTFRYKDYCADGRARYKRMTLATVRAA
jgi:hypothetical protein